MQRGLARVATGTLRVHTYDMHSDRRSKGAAEGAEVTALSEAYSFFLSGSTIKLSDRGGR